jgi:hypothetical protein
MDQRQLLIVGGVALVGIGILLYRRRKASQAQQAATASTATGGGGSSGTCADGSTVDCGGLCPDGTAPQGCTDYSGELATLQSEIGNLQSGGAQGGGGGTTGTTGDGGSGTPAPVPPGNDSPPPPPDTGSGGGTATAVKAGAVTGLHATNVTATGATVKWNPASHATSYAWGVRQMNGKQVKTGTAQGTDTIVTGLHPGWTYNFGIQGLPGGPGNNIHFTTKSK